MRPLRSLLLLAALAAQSLPLAAQEASAKLYARAVGDRVRAAIAIDVADGWHLYHSELGNPLAVGKPTVLTLGGPGIAWGEPRFPEPLVLDQPGMGPDGSDGWIYAHEGFFVVYAHGLLEPGAQASEAAAGATARISGLTCKDDGACIPYAEDLKVAGPGPEELLAAFPADLQPGAAPPAGAEGAGAGEGSPAEGSAEAEITTAEPLETAEPAGTAEPAATAEPARTPAEIAASFGWDYEPRPRGIGEEGGDSSAAPRGFLGWLLLAFVAGLILNVMPCVLPVVSIKVLSFVNQAGESRRRMFALGLAFGAGILAVFLVLAALAVVFKLNWGEQFQDSTFLIAMASIVFAFALSLFGLFEVGVPARVGELAGTQRREGLVSAFSMGILSTLLATPCSGPFLGSTLAWAVNQPEHVIFAVFGTAGLGMAAPYVLLTSNPAFLRFVPKPGPWMETFKHASGFLLLFTALFVFSLIPEEQRMWTLTFLVFVALGCWVWGHFATFEQTRPARYGTLAIAALVVALGGWVSYRGLPRFLAEGELWEPFDPVKLARYHAEGRNVFVDFTADWCLTCKTNEKFVYEDEEVSAALEAKRVACMKADETDGRPDQRVIQAFRNHLGAQSIPFAALFPADAPEQPYTLKDLVLKEPFLELVSSLP